MGRPLFVVGAGVRCSFARGHARYPHAAKRLAAARRYFDHNLEDVITLIDGVWHVRSLRDDVCYLVQADTTAHACTCADWQMRGAPLDTGSRYHCKHLLAIYAYKSMLAAQLTRRLCGDYALAYERRRAQLNPGAVVILRNTREEPAAAVYFTGDSNIPHRICAVRAHTVHPWLPRYPQSYWELAQWLDTVPDFCADAAPILIAA